MKDPLEALVQGATACCGAAVLPFPAADPGSRRRRLWELDAHAHCPVVGVCLPLATLRRLVDKALGGRAVACDYELHCGTIAECGGRTAIAQALHKELDRRYAVALRQAAAAKTSEALTAWWRRSSAGADLPGAFWATLTHARCDPLLERQVLGEVHMLQHQVGSTQRVDQRRFEAALAEAATLRTELAAQQLRQQRQAGESARQLDTAQAQLVRARADLIGRDTVIASLRDGLARLEASVPQLKSRIELAQQGERQNQRLVDLERALTLARQEAERQGRRADEALAAQALRTPDAAAAVLAEPVAALGDRAVLCVGGRPASVPLYRHIVERTGGRFLHHDGGEEESAARLDATLAAADLVICQTGCVSHGAYWRVKDHCKRTGKPCVFVDNPGSGSLKRALAGLQAVPER